MKTLYETLREQCAQMLPMHMPGHKRQAGLSPYLSDLGAGLDITEIDGFDNLHDAHGILREAMDRASDLWGSKEAFFLVNGSTCGIMAAVKACTRDGGKILLGRNSHRSVYNAVELFHLDPFYVSPATGVTAPEQIAQALDREPEIQTVLLTSPTYEGICSDIPAIAEIVHSRGKTLIIDQAHGAHFGFGHGFPESAVKQGADIVIHSLHKTLPSLTQTGILHRCSDRISSEALAEALGFFETSSPSYLLMASTDSCVALIKERGDELFSAWAEALDCFYEKCSSLRRLRILRAPCSDRSKILIMTDGTDITGPELVSLLRTVYRIEPEMCTESSVLALTGMGDTVRTLSALADALIEIDSRTGEGSRKTAAAAMTVPPKRFQPWRRGQADGVLVPLAGSIGRICLEYVWAYPPGIPLIVPGEEITPQLPAAVDENTAVGIAMKSSRGALPDKIFVQK